MVFLAGMVSCRQDTAVRPSGDAVRFDQERAFGYLHEQVAFGPRVPGTEAHEKARGWIVNLLAGYTSHVTVQPFTGIIDGRETVMKNILCSFYPENTTRVLLCAHWDSRIYADRDPDPANAAKPVPGANDGASGVAVLLEAAASIAAREPPVGVDIVLFDGEDDGTNGQNETWLLGSRFFAETMPPGYRPQYAILLDMIGDRDLSLSRDVNSESAAPALWNRIENACAEQGIRIEPQAISLLDDHIPLIQRGIPAVDLIDFEYPYWHTASDTPDKCSAESLGRIGRLVLGIVYEE